MCKVAKVYSAKSLINGLADDDDDDDWMDVTMVTMKKLGLVVVCDNEETEKVHMLPWLFVSFVIVHESGASGSWLTVRGNE